ncbi:glycosyltransferase family 2 protein [uncultured Clostridium sp.]|uniref:glycosyltransferase family 2 protein n=1 Tax=uncultured Clostridium sp. TaxID=59620 RepID=UPI0025E2A6E1|nr:glycosyltransferase family 2 protein [uncultured Clostridium sp.]MDU4323847.1 glycosyltransferase family 2 protein [Clostridium celatum]
MPKVSIIIPMYNVEKYLKRCIESVLNQTVKNLEIICVNDGSPDNCEEICNKYSKIDNRLKIINKKNGGLSSARNAGLKVAQGEFIYFLDPDDYIKEDMIFNMLNIAEENKCDVIITGYKTMPNEHEIIPLYDLNKKLNPLDMIKNNNLVHTHNDLCFVWRFLYKKNIIQENNIKFNEDVKVGEDFIFNLEVLTKCESSYVTKFSDYYYTIDNYDSIMRMKYKSNLEDSLILQYEIKRKISEESGLYSSEHYRMDMANYYINNMLPMIFKNIFNGPERNKHVAIKRVLKYKMFRDSFKEIGFLYKCDNYKEYIAYLILKFKIYPLAYKIITKQYKVN